MSLLQIPTNNTVETITKYRLYGVEYSSLDQLAKVVENMLGQVIDNMSQNLTIPLSSKQKLELFDQLVCNRTKIKNLLSVEYVTCTQEDGEDLTSSIFNLL